MLKKLCVSPFLALPVTACILLFCAVAGMAQEGSSASASQQASASKEPPIVKQQSAPTGAEAGEAASSRDSKKNASQDGPEELQKRQLWFYKQRASAKGRIPAGARLRALQHMRNMMQAEGRLAPSSASGDVQNAEGNISPETSPSSFPAWTSVGPGPTTGGDFSPVSGRVTTIAVDPSDTTGNTVLIGGAQGGIWRSTDAGATWTAVGDQNASLSMGSIAFAPSNSSIVYAGTGEQAGVGFDIYYGAGVLKSTNHGLTWTQTCSVPSTTCPFIGPYDDITPFGFFTLGGTRISYVAVNPTNPQMVLVGAQTQFSEGTTEGVYCSDNGGSTWTNILPDEMSTFVGFASSSVAYAAFGSTFGSSPNAPNGNGIYKATSIGSTCSTVHFTHLTSGTLPPQSAMGRIDLGIAPSDASGNTLYASIADASNASATNLGVYFSSNGGSSWTKTSAPDICQNQCWYDDVVKVDPQNAGIVFWGGGAVLDNGGNPAWVVRSTNSGTTWSSVIPVLPLGSAGLPHVDNHAMAFVKLPTGKMRMYLGNDGGMWRTDDDEAASVQWTNLNNASLTLTQFYPAISMHPGTPLFSIAGSQDNGTQIYSGVQNWADIGVCGDGTGTAVDPFVPSSVYVTCNGIFLFSSYQNGATGTFAPASNGINLSDFSNFVAPLTADPNTANTLYLGTTKVYQSVDAANTWTAISNDLVNSGNFESLTAIAVAPDAPQVVYAGSSSGELFIATNVSAGGFGNFTPVAITPRTISAIAVDPADKTGATAYVASSGFSYVNSSLGINDPLGHIFRSTSFAGPRVDVSCSVANCMKPAATDLPNIPVNDIVVDPDVPGTIYAATDLGVFIGNCSTFPCTWDTLSSGLPRVAVLSLRMHEASRTLRAATHGRGAWDLKLNNFSFSGPHVASITPVSVNAGGTQFTLTVNGSGLTGGNIQFGSTALTATGTSSDTSLSGVVPTSLLTAGTVQITVKISSATSNALPFPVLALAPTITTITPSSTPVQPAFPGTSVTAQLAGTNFSNNAKVLFNGGQNGITVATPSVACPVPTCLKATLPGSLLGFYGSTDDIVVLNPPPGGGPSQAKAFRVVAPAPANDNFANATNIGTLNFIDVQDSSGATTESADPTPPCVNQFSSGNGNSGGHPNGDYNTIWYKFTPQFSANLSLDTSGSSYDTVLSVWKGTPGSLTNIACNDDISSGVQLQSAVSGVTLTAGTTYYIMVSSFGPPDRNPVALGGRSQLSFLYNSGLFPQAVLTSISPTSANSGDAGFTLALTGSGFFSGAGVQFVNSSTFFGSALTTTFVSSTKLTAAVPASAIVLPGPFAVSVNNPTPNFGVSNSLPFTVNVGTYPVPTLGSIFPATDIAGSLPFSIGATGTNFAPNAVLKFNGVAEPTTVVNPQFLTAMISTADIAAAGSVQVTVTNPTPGGGPSGAQPFVITVPTVVPTISSISPSSIPAGTGTSVTITGTGFTPGVSLFITNFGFIAPTSSTSTQLTLMNLFIGTPGIYPIFAVDQAPGGTSTAFNLTVTGPPDFSITSTGVTSATVAAGTTGTFTNAISVTPQNGFSAAVALTCGMPSNATATHCSISPGSLASGSGTATVSVTTTARGFVVPSPQGWHFRPSPHFVSATLLIAMLLMWRFTRRHRARLALSFPIAGVLLFLLMQSAGCGGGGGTTIPPPPPPPSGTPANTYTVTVTGTSGALTRTTTLTLIVQ